MHTLLRNKSELTQQGYEMILQLTPHGRSLLEKLTVAEFFMPFILCSSM
jgi:hypothetical protein